MANTFTCHINKYKLSEAVVGMSSLKKCYWKFRKIRRRTPVPESLFKKSYRPRPATLLKESLAGVFLWILQNYQEQLFYRTPLVATFKLSTFRSRLNYKTNLLHNISAMNADVITVFNETIMQGSKGIVKSIKLPKLEGEEWHIPFKRIFSWE